MGEGWAKVRRRAAAGASLAASSSSFRPEQPVAVTDDMPVSRGV